MDQYYSDVNFKLGSWGYQPEDRRGQVDIPVRSASSLLQQRDWYELAVRFAQSSLEAIADGREDDAALYAKGCLTFCRKFQLAGGQPWD